MIVGKVVGNIVSTRKNDKLLGCKLLIVDPLTECGFGDKRFVAVDQIGAGIGEIVLVSQGSASRSGSSLETSPADAVIVGIVDNINDIVVL